MEKRPLTTGSVVIGVCKRNLDFMKSVWRGLQETPLHDFYSNLNLDEAVAFSAGSWNARSLDIRDFRGFVKNSKSMYEVFNMVNDVVYGAGAVGNGFGVEKMRGLHSDLNPFDGRNLRERLERVDPEAIERLQEQLQDETFDYDYEGFYHKAKANAVGDTSRLRIYRVGLAYPRAGRMIDKFGLAISRDIRQYPREYEPLEVKEEVQEMLF